MNIIAAIQMCSSTQVEENLETVERLIEQAAKASAALVVLPEMFACFNADSATQLSLKELPGKGKIQDRLKMLSKKYKIWIVGGSIPLATDSFHKIKASCMVYSSGGEIVARYDKMHLFDVRISEHEAYKESDLYTPGHEVTILDTPIGRLGLCICFDLRFPNLFAELSAQGVELIACPAAFTLTTGLAHWKLLLRSRAIDTFSYMIGAAQGGLHAQGRKTYGHSMIVSPWGEVIEELDKSGNGLVFSEIDLKKLHQIREQIPVHP